jgi:hypothetical protein
MIQPMPTCRAKEVRENEKSCVRWGQRGSGSLRRHKKRVSSHVGRGEVVTISSMSSILVKNPEAMG